ncbi:SDR family oxidoreductase, partial [Streptomyces cyaneofuscatus]|uniref:SDR family oxidoreductase n=2 Tax=Streptomyces cyaneofuscatus TaxID=66883 RepID=UPI0004C918E0
LLAIWSTLLDTPCTDPTANFFELGGDSITALRAVAMAAGDGLPFRLADLYVAPTAAELADLVGRRLAEDYPAEEDHSAEFSLAEADGQLDPDLVFRPVSPALDGPQEILLTGVTGFLGGHLLAELLRSTGARVHCLVRAADETAGLARVEAALATAGATADSVRIGIILGDLADERLGLAPETAAELAGRVDTVVHVAAAVNGALSYAALRQVNVLGTEALLAFVASCARPVTFHHISSDSAARPWQSGYGLSKLVAERLVLAAGERGLRVLVHRLGRISAATGTGRWQEADFASMVIRGSIDFGRFPDPDEMPVERWSPVDELVRLLAGQVRDGVPTGPALRYVVGELVSFGDVADWIRAAGIRLDIVSLAEWRQELRDSPENPAFGIYPWLADAPSVAPRKEVRVEEAYRVPLGATVDASSLHRYLASAGLLPKPEPDAVSPATH